MKLIVTDANILIFLSRLDLVESFTGMEFDIHTTEGSDIKKIQSKISSLEMKESIGGDAEIQEKINLLTNGFQFWFDLVVFEI